jgi:hypothetical protein
MEKKGKTKKILPRRRPPQRACVGLAWYDPAEWDDWRAACTDGDRMEATHDQWKQNAERSVAQLRERGIEVERVPIRLEDFLQWCSEQGRNSNSSARAEYVAQFQRSRHKV